MARHDNGEQGVHCRDISRNPFLLLPNLQVTNKRKVTIGIKEGFQQNQARPQPSTHSLTSVTWAPQVYGFKKQLHPWLLGLLLAL